MDYQERKQAIKRALGARLKEFREAKRLSQAELARLMGQATASEVPASRIGNYEQGTRLPSPIDIAILAEILETSEAEIYGFASGVTGEERVLLHKYRLTDDRGRKTIQGIADAQPTYVTGTDGEEKAADDGQKSA